MSDLSAEHANFYERFKSFWAAPSGERVLQIIAPDAVIHFTGAGHMSGRDYAAWTGEALARFEGLAVTPMDCAGNRRMFWTPSPSR